MTDMWTDDHVAELFASANPVPKERRPGHLPATVAEPAARADGGVTFDLGDRPLVAVDDERRERWWLVVGVAATVALVVSLLVATAFGDSPQPADEPETTVPDATPVVEAADRDVRRAYDFIAALNDADAEAAGALIEPGAPISIAPMSPIETIDKGVTLEGQIAWREAWHWRWEEPSCRVDEQRSTPDVIDAENIPTPRGADVGEGRPDVFVEFDTIATCTFTSRNRLGGLTDRPQFGSLRLRLLDGRITHAEGSTTGDEWRPVIRPFLDWAEAERAEDWAKAWDEGGPLLTVESAVVERRVLDEYVALNGDDPSLRRAYEFMAAVNSHDAAAASALVAPSADVEVVPDGNDGDGVAPLDVQFAWQDAFDWQWAEYHCVSPTARLVNCNFVHRNRLLDHEGRQLRGGAVFSIGDTGIERITWSAEWDSYGDALEQFVEWVNTHHPDEAVQIWYDGNDGAVISTEAANTLSVNLDRYLAASGGQ